MPKTENVPHADANALDVALDAARRGDHQAFATLFRAVQPTLVRYLRVMVAEDAEDVASETWAQVVRDLRGFRGDADGFRGWVFTIGRNRALDALRARRRRPVDPRDPADLSAGSAAPDAADLAQESLATRRALALIARLPRDQAEAVYLRVVAGFDGPGAAKVLGKRPGAVRMATARGLATLRELAETEYPPQV